jgi:chromosomal replication initiation ATPase DnaA
MAAFGHSRCELVAATRRSADVAFARQVAMYLAHVGAGLSMSEVGRGFGRDRTTVAHACRHVEDRRDDPRIEAMLVCLEAAMVTWRSYALIPRASRPGSRQ